MEALRKWLVGLDLTDHDHSILKYTKMLSDILHPEHIEFVFVAQRLPDTVHAHLQQELKYPEYDELVETLKAEVQPYFGSDNSISIEVLGGPDQLDLWHEAYEKDIDLFIAGNKPRHKGRGLFLNKFIRKSICSVLFIPLDAPDNIGKIWVPTDFSAPAGTALELALQIAEANDPQGLVWVHHIYQLPHTYYFQEFPRNKILEAIRKDAEEGMATFCQAHNPKHVPLETRFTELYGSFVANSIKETAEESEADLIVMASGGRSRFSKFILGSETEQLLQLEVHVPLMIYKKKTDHKKLWDLYSINN